MIGSFASKLVINVHLNCLEIDDSNLKAAIAKEVDMIPKDPLGIVYQYLIYDLLEDDNGYMIILADGSTICISKSISPTIDINSYIHVKDNGSHSTGEKNNSKSQIARVTKPLELRFYRNYLLLKFDRRMFAI